MNDAQDSIDFRRWTLPIRGGQREERESVDAEARGRLDYRSCRLGAGAMPGGTREAARRGPTAVAVGNDGDVEGARRQGLGLKIGLDYRDVSLREDG